MCNPVQFSTKVSAFQILRSSRHILCSSDSMENASMENAQLLTPPPPPPPSPRGDKKSYTGKPRGRPRGSKNKPKPPVIINKEHPNALSSHILEIYPTHDIVKSMSDFAAKRHRGMCVMSASGTVTNVVLRQPPLPHQQNNSHVMTNSSVVNFTGMFEILSMSGAFFPSPAPPPASGISVQLSGGHGQVVGGKVVGPLVAVSTVVIVVASFATSLYNKLPLSEERGRNNNIENENLTVTVAVPGMGGGDNLPFLVPQMPMMAMNNNPTSAVEGTASSSGVFNGLVGGNAHNDMAAEEFWGVDMAGRPLPF